MLLERGCGFNISTVSYMGFLGSDSHAIHSQVFLLLHQLYGHSATRAAFYANKFFPPLDRAQTYYGGDIDNNPRNAGTKMKQYYRSPDVLKKVLRFLQHDYDRL